MAAEGPMEWEEENIWLRRRIMRLRPLLRHAKDPHVMSMLKEFIGEAEERLEMLESKQIGNPPESN
jgi:hypothetical protein